jgi:hypothetical protein
MITLILQYYATGCANVSFPVACNVSKHVIAACKYIHVSQMSLYIKRMWEILFNCEPKWAISNWPLVKEPSNNNSAGKSRNDLSTSHNETNDIIND